MLFPPTRYRSGIFALLCAVSISLSIGPAPAAAEQLTFGHYAGFRFTAADAQNRIAEMNALAGEGAGEEPTNTPCIGLRYTLGAAPKPYDSKLPTQIYGPDDILAFKDSPFSIHIVSVVGYCNNFSGRVDACTVGGTILVAKNHANDANVAALIYLHELGHSNGLDNYADSHNPSFRNFMYYLVKAGRKGKQRYQCDALRGLREQLLIAPAQAQELDRPPLEDFVGAIWLHGVPTAAVQQLTEEDLKQVRNWIAQDAYAYWPNSVTILGLRGNNADIELLQKVLNAKSEDNFVKSAKLNVPRALGSFAYRTGNVAAVELLRDMMSPRENIRFLAPSATIDDDDATVLALEATQGMAVFAATGNAQALKLLAEQQLKNERGAINLGVGPSFFKQTEKLTGSVKAKGLIEGLRVQE